VAKRTTIERVLRDDGDNAGQSIRDWKIEAENNHVTLRSGHDLEFIMLRKADIDLLIADLQQARDLA